MKRLSLLLGKPSRLGLLGLVVALVYFAFSILVGLYDLLFVVRHHTRLPFGDHWIWLERLYKYGLPATLASQFNEHRLVIPGICYFFDHRYFGATNSFLAILLLLMQVGCIIFMILPLWRQTAIPWAVRLVFAGFVVITLLWFIEAEDFFFPYQLCFICCNFAILATLHLFAQFVERNLRLQRSVWIFVGVLSVALCATFSNGHGILLWPVLLVLSLVLRLPRRWIWALLAVMLCAIGIYFFHYRTPVIHASPLESLRRPVMLVHYVVLMIGLPFFGAGTQDIELSTNVASYAISISGILLAVILLLRYARTRALQQRREQIVYCSLILICLAACVITALGRSRFPLWQALSSRYAPIPLLFWIALAGLITTELFTREIQTRFWRVAWCALLIVASLITLPTQFSVGPYMASRQRVQTAVGLSIALGIPDVPRINQELSLILERVQYVDHQATLSLGHSLFWRPEPSLLGTRLLEHFRLLPASECRGFVDEVRLLPEPALRGVHLLGWAWDAKSQRPVTGIWVVDDDKVIRGLGITGIYRPDVAAVYSNGAMRQTGWFAYSQMPVQSSALTTFVSLHDTQSVCQIGAPRMPLH